MIAWPLAAGVSLLPSAPPARPVVAGSSCFAARRIATLCCLSSAQMLPGIPPPYKGIGQKGDRPGLTSMLMQRATDALDPWEVHRGVFEQITLFRMPVLPDALGSPDEYHLKHQKPC